MSEKVVSPRADGVQPNPGRLTLYRQEVKMPSLKDPIYLAAVEQGMPFFRDSLAAVFEASQVEAIVYPTNPKSTARVGEEPPSPSGVGAGAPTNSPYTFANLTGFPELTIPAGFNGNRLPVGISFFGRAWSEPRLLALGYAYEQATHAIRTPVHAPPLAGERFEY
jgi:amidase